MRNSFRDLTFEELLVKRQELKKKYLDIRFDIVIGHVDNHLYRRTLRRDISRLNTLIYNHPDIEGGSAAG